LTAEELDVLITKLRVDKLKKELKSQVDSVVRSELRNISSHSEDDYEALIRQDEAKKVPGLGDEGVPVVLQGEEVKRAEELMKVEAFNILLSDRIPYSRKLPDARNPKYLFFCAMLFTEISGDEHRDSSSCVKGY
jgi:hypothetical protein